MALSSLVRLAGGARLGTVPHWGVVACEKPTQELKMLGGSVFVSLQKLLISYLQSPGLTRLCRCYCEVLKVSDTNLKSRVNTNPSQQHTM